MWMRCWWLLVRSGGPRSQAQPSSAVMMTLNGRACARGQRRMSEGDIVRTSDLLRPRHVGMPIRRTEDPRLLTGNGEYASDRKPDRALHVAFRRSEQPHAMIVRIEVDGARAAPGVVAVLTAEDLAADYKPVKIGR